MTVIGKVVSINKGGLMVEVENLRGFVPMSQIPNVRDSHRIFNLYGMALLASPYCSNLWQYLFVAVMSAACYMQPSCSIISLHRHTGWT